MAMASALALLLAPRPVSASARPTSPHLHSRRLALPPPRPTAISAPAATQPRKVGSLQQLHAAFCCSNSAPATGTSGGGATGAKDWRFLLAWYLMSLDKNPIATKAVTSAVLTLAGDLICQLVIDRVPELDLRRTFVFTLLGLALVGPTLHVLVVTVSGASGAIARLILDQFIFSPIFIGVFMSLLVTFEGKPSLVVPKLKQEWLSSVLANWQLWIPFQFLNFYFVPQKFQVLAANFVALAWNVILSFKAHKEVTAK
ncbi:protein sym-1-like [Panicum miliaceum]|uniref:Protein sym-1-like n=1 Tax=Panicum miliaceum TaxID=4540 RepID=A0A3L6SY47_PANMI|nr:protein sym-1-like [Panicum miliaceum]